MTRTKTARIDGSHVDLPFIAEAVRGTDDATIEDSVVSVLRQAITTGLLAPGMRLGQEALASKLGISRIPLRDAFRRLEAEGLIHIDGRRGARVVILELTDVVELYELRSMLEPRCIRLAIRHLTQDERTALAELGATLEAGSQHADSADIAWRPFYRELFRHSGRPRMVQLIDRLRTELSRYETLKSVPTSLAVHHRIRECVREGDATGAAHALHDDIRRSRDALLAVLRHEQRPVARARRPRRVAVTS